MTVNRGRVIQDLKTYRHIPVIIKNLQELKKLKEFDLDIFLHSSNVLEEHRNSNFSEYTATERQAERRDLLKAEIQEIDFKILEHETLWANMQRSLEVMDKIGQKIITMRYLDGLTWVRISMELHYSDKSCRAICNKTLDVLSVVMYGQEGQG